MKRILSIVAALSVFASPSAAQDGAHPHPALDAVNASQDGAIATIDGKADAALIENIAQDGTLSAQDDAIADLIAKATAITASIDQITIATEALAASIADLERRVTALEAGAGSGGGGGPPPPPDPVPLPSLSISADQNAAPEGALFTFTVTRAGDLSRPASVAYTVSGAADIADFAAGSRLSDIVVFGADEAQKTLALATQDDAVVETDEAFDVTLSAPIDAVLGSPFAARAIIVNNDAAAPPPPTGPPPSNGALFPNTDDGLPILQLNLNEHLFWSGQIPYKNLRLLNPEYGGKAKVEAGEADPTTGWIFLKPNETLTLGRTRPVAADGFNTDPGQYVLKATVRAGSTATINAPGFSDDGSAGLTIRKSAVLDDQDLNGGQVELQGGAAGGWINVDFWGPTKFENDPLGWHPNFIVDTSPYKLLRFLDLTKTNGSGVTEASEWIDDGDYTVWQCSNCRQGPASANNHLRKFGYAYGRMFDLANKADSAVWVNIPIAMGAGSIKAEVLGRDQAALKSAIVANFPAIEAQSKIEFRALGDKLARSALNNGYPDNKVLLVELGNEIWNYGNASFAATSAYADGVGLALTGKDFDTGTGIGHIAVIAFDACRQSFAAIKPNQELKFVIGVQTMGSTFRAQKATAEFKRYSAALGVSPSLQQEVFLATTGYYSGGFEWNAKRSPGALNNPFGVSTEAEFNAAFAAADQDGSLFTKEKAWYLGPLSANVNVARVIKQTVNWRDFAVSNGWRGLLQYEGSPADLVGSGAGQLGAVYPASAGAWRRWQRSQEAFDVQDQMIRQLSAIDPMNPAVTTGWHPPSLVVSNYSLIGRSLTYTAPWVEKTVDEAGMCPPVGVIGAWCAHGRQPSQ